jgi:GTPase SAR1 family protein
MADFLLENRVNQLLKFALDLTDNEPSLGNLHNQLQQCYTRLQQPMRVAIVGLIKAGKSTMMNALLGEEVVATGNVEATFNVNVLRYSDRSSILVHFKDGRPSEAKSISELAAVTLRAEENRDYLLSIKYIEVCYPNKILETFNLIDTPGLESYYKEDSDNTLNFLQLHGQKLTEITQTEAQGADAVLYLFSHSLATEDKAIVELFQGPVVGQATPINAIGVLTKVDTYWSDPNISDPMDAGNRICQRLSTHSQVRNLFYGIKPICGLLALGAQTLTNDEWQILIRLAELPQERMDSLLRNVTRFCTKEYPDVAIPSSERQKVYNRLGQYGVSLAYSRIRSGIKNQAELTNELLKVSGVPQLRDLIISHFGHRAFLIKLGTVLRQINVACFLEIQKLEGKEQQIVAEISGYFEELQSQDHGFSELQILRNYYDQKLKFDSEEVKELLQVTGEYGTSCEEKLGLAKGSNFAQMLTLARARKRYWQEKAADIFESDRNSIAAAKVMARSYERIIYRLHQM